MKKLLSLLLLVGAMSCEKEGNLTSTCNIVDLSVAAGTLSDAANAYSVSQSKENCERYKAALTSYLNKVDGCPQVNAADIAAAKKEADELICK